MDNIKFKKNGVYYLSSLKLKNKFESLYLKIREKENRLYPDNLILKLPDVPDNHIYEKEWLMRKFSADKVLKYLNKYPENRHVLDLGCGNGWFSNALTLINKKVTALDLNIHELEQGAKLFSNPNLQFYYGKITDDIFNNSSFDIICMNSVIQYFSDPDKLISILFKIIRQEGEILIWDSPFYTGNEVVEAKNRTYVYYKNLGFKEMAEFYHHHSVSVIKKYKAKTLYQPKWYMKFSRKNYSPFPILKIKK